jgi:23S rRNA (cytosine1962-C5)-methyltransferase
MDRITLVSKPADGYALLDSGREEKLERFGEVILSRPDPQALWEKRLSTDEWAKAAGRFERDGKEGKWLAQSKVEGKGKELPQEWQVALGGLKLLIKPTSFKHTGLFPEQLPNWEWAGELIKAAAKEKRSIKVLNLFGYTGGATLAAAKACPVGDWSSFGVTHVDASKTAVAWARENAVLSGLGEAPIRWITDDALTFVKREVRRLAESAIKPKYDAIIMDPPAFGHGPDGELWKFEEHFLELVELCHELLSDKPLFVLMNGYAAGYSPLMFAYNLESFEKKFGGTIEYGDLAIAESTSDRTLPAGIFARWQA